MDERHAGRKTREIDLLQRCLREPLPLPARRDAADVLRHKLKVASAVRAERSLDSWAITETARPAVRAWRCGAFRLGFAYQRADLAVRGPSIYPDLDAGRYGYVEETIYTASGMGAIAAFVMALVAVRGSVEVIGAPGGYGETRELLERFGPRVRTTPLDGAPPVDRAHARRVGRTDDRPCIAWLDSAVATGFAATMDRVPHRSELVVFDTTCFARGSSNVRRVLRWARERDVPLALLRSHAKLDSLGIEYGRMGSMVLAWRRRGGHAWMRDLVREARGSVRLLGCAAVPAHFPPFTGDPDYAPLCMARTASIVRATRRLARRLGDTPLGGGMVRYRHGLYLTLAPRGDWRMRDVKRAVDRLCDALAASGLPVRHAGSFGFDFVAIDWFADPLTRRHVVRVAPGDLPAPIVDAVADGIVHWFEAQRSRPALASRGAPERSRRGDVAAAGGAPRNLP